MTSATLSLLDQEELLGLALQAGRNNDSGTTLVYLKEAVSRPDATATAHYLLGVEYAQLQMMPRAIAELASAIAIDPGLSIARLQLGMMLLTPDTIEHAIPVLQALEELEAQNPLHQFGRGLIHLIQNQFADALHCLGLGMELNLTNPPLNGDMQKIIDEIKKLPAPGSTDPASAESDETPGAQHLFFNAYTSNNLE